MEKLKTLLQRSYRASLSPERQEEQVWEELKAHCVEIDLDYGIHERRQTVSLNLSHKDGSLLSIYHCVSGTEVSSRSIVFYTYPEELTTDIFILTTHLNNVTKGGKITVNPKTRHIEYICQADSWRFLNRNTHFAFYIKEYMLTVETIIWAYNQLIKQGQEPALIIADMLGR